MILNPNYVRQAVKVIPQLKTRNFSGLVRNIVNITVQFDKTDVIT